MNATVRPGPGGWGTIQIHTITGHLPSVRAQLIGPFAVHQYDNLRWHVSHTRTGLRIFTFPTKAQAVSWAAAARRLLDAEGVRMGDMADPFTVASNLGPDILSRFHALREQFGGWKDDHCIHPRELQAGGA